MIHIYSNKILLCILLGSLLIFAAIAPAHPAEIVNTDARTQQSRCHLISTFKTFQENNQTIFEIKTSGRGAFYKYKNAQILVESRLGTQGDFLKPMTTMIRIVDLDDHRALTRETRFDYEKKKIFIRSFDEKTKVLKNYVFRIKGPTVDYASLFYFLKPYIARLAKNKIQHFYLLSFESRMYGVNLKFVKKEILNLPGGRRNSVKVRLIADFVKVGEAVFDKIIPPTFIWFQDQSPYAWLKYQGMETGYPSPYIIAYLK